MIHKKIGGLRIRNLRLHNKSLLFKWLYKFNDGNEKSDEMWNMWKILVALFLFIMHQEIVNGVISLKYEFQK